MEPEPPAGTYRHLLAALLDRSLDTREETADVGVEWGRALAAAHHGADDPATTVVAVLDALGFAPRAAGPDVHLTECPYLELVRQNPDAMCGVHAGIVAGVLETTGGGTVALEPFAAPGACLVRLRL
jgi:predicted ArsR family transcriptional regulator